MAIETIPRFEALNTDIKNPKQNKLDIVPKIDGQSCFQAIAVSSRVSCVSSLSSVEHASISLALTLLVDR